MRYVFLVLTLLVATMLPALAQNKDEALTDAQKTAVEAVIQNYLTKEHPEVLMQAMQELQRRNRAGAEEKSAEGVKKNEAKLYNDPNTPVGGNPKGDVTIVEFSDFQCGYCKMSEPFIEKILQEDKGVRFIYKDFPVLGPASTTAAKVALAVFRQGNDKYLKFHDDLLSKKEHLTDDMIYQTAKDAGANLDKVKKDVADPSIQKQVQANLDLGAEIGVQGTPMFIVGGKTYPGALQYDQLKQAIEEARTAAKKG